MESKFVVKNISNKMANLFGMNIMPGSTYNLCKIPGVDRFVLEKAIYYGSIGLKLKAYEIYVIENDFSFQDSSDDDLRILLNSVIRTGPNMMKESFNLDSCIENYNKLTVNSSAIDQEIKLPVSKLNYPCPIIFEISAGNKVYFASTITIKGYDTSNKYIEEVCNFKTNKYSTTCFKTIDCICIPAGTLGGILDIVYLNKYYGLSQKPTNIISANINGRQVPILFDGSGVGTNNSALKISEYSATIITATDNAILQLKNVNINEVFTKNYSDMDGSAGEYLVSVEGNEVNTRKLKLTFSQILTGNAVLEGLDCYGQEFTEIIPLGSLTHTTKACYLSLRKITIPAQAVSYTIQIGITNHVGFNYFKANLEPTNLKSTLYIKMDGSVVPESDFTVLSEYDSYPNGSYLITASYIPNSSRIYCLDYCVNHIKYDYPNSIKDQLDLLKNGESIMSLPNGSVTFGAKYHPNIIKTNLKLNINYSFTGK